ncbi:hypothetical protein [Micromonospora maritima]|uniref:hypothetical protein n=1 Tax=Micromonospora maritima TaxID=986711 RepID=UPI00157E258A|nr:hypothetical protein [Micromonospora maritima]
MIDAFSTAVARHRRPVLVVGLLVAAGNAVAMGYAPDLARALLLPVLALALTALILAIVTLGNRPAALVALPRPLSFSPPVAGWRVLLALGLLGQASTTVGAYLRSAEAGIDTTIDAVLGVLWLALIALVVRAAVRGHDVRLDPEGLHVTGLLGSRTVPWAAGPAAEAPGDDGRSSIRLPLTVARPELVRRHGLVVGRPRLPTDGVDARFLAAVISHYVAHPQHRSAIGTPEEYRRLHTHLRGATG